MSNVFPQNGDNDSGSNFSIWLNRENISDYVHTGIQFINVDYTNLLFDLSEGHCFISYNNEDKVVYIEPSEFTGISLTDNATNHVFLDVDFATNNSVSVLVNTTSSAPSGAYIKLGEIDTSNNAATEMNRDPAIRGRSATFDSLTLRGSHDLNGNDLVDSGTLIWNSSIGHIPERNLEQGSGSGLNADLVDGSHASDLGSSVSDDGTTIVSPATDINFASNINVTDDGDGTVTVDGASGTSASDNGTLVADAVSDINFSRNLSVTDDGDGTVTVDGVDDSQFAEVTGDTFTGDITMSDDYDINFGSDSDFEMFYESANDRLTIEDGSGTQLMHAYKSGVVDFVNGIDVGVIESPTDSNTELINTDITSTPSAGTIVGYTFAINSQTVIGIEGEADGSGGLQDKDLNFHQNEAENFVLDNESSDPSSPVVGQMWYRADLD